MPEKTAITSLLSEELPQVLAGTTVEEFAEHFNFTIEAMRGE